MFCMLAKVPTGTGVELNKVPELAWNDALTVVNGAALPP
jgi:hypothetical protein